MLPVGLLLATGHGYPAARLQLSGGGAWLASPAQGVVTLLDGSAEAVIGSVLVPAARAGDNLQVVQAGSSAYVTNGSQGTVSRVDGGTYEVGPAVRFGQAGGALSVLAGGPGLFVVDGSRRAASVTDPVTLRVRQRLSLATRPGPGQSIVDGTGRLWVVDQAGLASFGEDGKRVWPELGAPGSQLVLVRGEPVLVDPSRSRIGRLDPDGVVSWSCLDVQAGEQVRLLGSATTSGVFAVAQSTATLLIAGTTDNDCGTSLEVGRQGDHFGELAEVDGYVFVPNQSTGRTVVVDAARRRVVADLPVLAPGRRLELVAKDGLVFYNDLDGDRAGVLKLVGGQWVAGKPLRKYQPGKVGDSLLVPSGNQAPGNRQDPQDPNGTNPADPKPTRTPDPSDPANDPTDPGNPTDPEPTDPVDPTDPVNPNDPNDPGNPVDPSNPGGTGGPGTAPPTTAPPTTTPPTSPPPTSPPPTNPPAPPQIQNVSVEPSPIVRGRPATFSGVVANDEGATWTWVVRRPDGGELARSTAVGGFVATLPADAPDQVVVQLDVARPDGARDSRTTQFTTTSRPVPSIGSIAANPANPAPNQRVTFTATESVAGPAGQWEWTVAALDGGPGGTGPVRQAAFAPFAFTFTRTGNFQVTLRVSFDGEQDQEVRVITVTDQCRITRSSPGSPFDIAGTARVTLVAGISGCFNRAAATPTFATGLAYLRPVGGITLSHNPATGQGTASQVVELVGEPPTATQVGPRFRLPNGSAATWQVRTLDPTPVVPNVIDERAADASATLRDAGFRVLSQSRVDNLCEFIGRVMRQSPEGGTSAPRGSTVTITIGQRPPAPRQCP